jgi:hypothetical protein
MYSNFEQALDIGIFSNVFYLFFVISHNSFSLMLIFCRQISTVAQLITPMISHFIGSFIPTEISRIFDQSVQMNARIVLQNKLGSPPSKFLFTNHPCSLPISRIRRS